MSNNIKTTFLLASTTAIFMLMGNLLGGHQGMFIALIFAAGINFLSYWYSDQIVLKMYDAKEASPSEFPQLHLLVRTLALNANLPMPKIFVMNQEVPNAFATGRNEKNSVIAVTKGLIKIMDEKELSGVLAHELAHIKNKDILIGTIVATMAGAITMLASMARWTAIFGGTNRQDENNGRTGMLGLVLTSILAPLAATIIQLAISRTREYLADSVGAKIAGNPNGLANALQKLEKNHSSNKTMNIKPSTAHMFIINPLSSKKVQSLFATHPPINERVRKLLGKNDNKSTIKSTDNSGKDFWEFLSNR